MIEDWSSHYKPHVEIFKLEEKYAYISPWHPNAVSERAIYFLTPFQIIAVCCWCQPDMSLPCSLVHPDSNWSKTTKDHKYNVPSKFCLNLSISSEERTRGQMGIKPCTRVLCAIFADRSPPTPPTWRRTRTLSICFLSTSVAEEKSKMPSQLKARTRL